MRWFVVPCLLLVLPSDDAAVLVVGRLKHSALKEVSGVVASRRHSGIFWVHNDSGNPPALFAVKRDGTLVREFAIAAPNVDWEDIAIDDAGHLYMGDIGNNAKRLAVRVIYQIDEPDPAAPADAPLPTPRSTFYRFASPEARFDAEALFLLDGRAVVITKRSDGREAELMALPLDRPSSLLRPATPQPIGKLPGLVEQVTGADLSRDCKRLAVVTYRHVFVYGRSENAWRPLGRAKHGVDLAEAICWDGADLLVVGESRTMAIVPEALWRSSGP